ncbi:GNAT family N-acetyltransferase [Streptomyces ficellus]|uniref:GNAT family N-acetyltransferase n=1 Tax=Streptomyces ficellus TaxID=1977088 RepID=A0ABT7YZ77_9ACTN|nr:GNAT family N-acetyltransferase [Streptomyces ficellus]MDN3292539.1 GNAT family N-acetyltransferase [Streptomyces ficellus]
MSELSVAVLDRVNDRVVEDVNRLIPQLGKDTAGCDAAHLERVIGNASNVVLAARLGPRVVGLLTLVVVVLPTGVTSRLEDVVVDREHRGRGIGLALVQEALREAKRRGAQEVDLTSRPSRVAAHRLYEKVGFVRRETDVFRYAL